MINQFTIEGQVVAATWQPTQNSDLLKVQVALTSPGREGRDPIVNSPWILVWGRGEEFASQFEAGVTVTMTGMIQTRDWEFEGQPRMSTELVAGQVAVFRDKPAAKPTAKAAGKVKAIAG